MRTKKIYLFFNLLFAAAVAGLFVYHILGTTPKTPENSVLTYFPTICIGLCFLLSLVTIKLDPKKIFLVLMLAFYVASDLFMVILNGEYNMLIGLCFACGAQVMLCLYTVYINHGIGKKVTNIAVRVAVCVIAYFVLRQFFTFTTIQVIALMYFINLAISFVLLLFYIKIEGWLVLGCLVLLVSSFFVGLVNGGAEVFGIGGKLLEIAVKYPIGFYCYIPGLFVVATASVWANKYRG